MLLVAVSFASSFAGSILAWVLVFHYDLEHRWEAWRLRRGKHLTQPQLERAESRRRPSGSAWHDDYAREQVRRASRR